MAKSTDLSVIEKLDDAALAWTLSNARKELANARASKPADPFARKRFIDVIERCKFEAARRVVNSRSSSA
jgi:hypothetical protein